MAAEKATPIVADPQALYPIIEGEVRLVVTILRGLELSERQVWVARHLPGWWSDYQIRKLMEQL